MLFKPLLLLSTLLCGAGAKLKTYPIPGNITQSTSFEVKVRQGHRPWEAVDIYQIGLHEVNTTTGDAALRHSSLAYFDFTDTVEVSIEYKTAPAKSVRVRPESYGVVPKLGQNKMTLKLSEPQNLVVQFNDEVFDCLHLLAAAFEEDIPSENDEDVIFYGPGVHGTVGADLDIPTGKTLYLAGGAVLRSNVRVNGSSDAIIRGRGMMYKPELGISVAYSNNTVISGVTLINANIGTGQADGVHIRDVKSFSATQWGDGMDFYCSQNVLVEKVFFRNSDDCVAIYNHRDAWVGDSKNITVKDSALWADVAHPVNIGTHGNTPNPETMSEITLQNIDILDHREPQVDYQGCIAINPGDNNFVKDVLIDNIRVEDFRLGQLVNIRVMYNQKYNTSPGRGVQNVKIRNMMYTGTHAGMAIFSGYNETRTVSNITFEGLNINRKDIHDSMRKPGWYMTSDYIPAYVNEHVKNLTFLA